MRPYAKTIIAIAGSLTLAAFVLAGIATVKAYQYRARTNEGFVFVYVMAAWAGVLLLAAAAAGLSVWLVRRERR